MNDEALQYSNRAIAIANANPDAGYPIIRGPGQAVGYGSTWSSGGSKRGVEKLLDRPEAQASDDQLSELNSTSRANSPVPGGHTGCIAYLSEAAPALRDRRRPACNS